MILIYGSYDIPELNGVYGKKVCKLDCINKNRRMALIGAGKLNGKELVIEQFSDTEYVIHLKERLQKYYDELLYGSLKNIDKNVREKLIDEINKTYERMIDTVTPDKVNRITLPKEIVDRFADNQKEVILKGYNTTMSLFLNEEDYQQKISR